MAQVTQLRPALVNDIPTMLRRMADDIEAGRQQADASLFIIPRAGSVDVYGWGEHLGDYGNIAVCEMAKAWFLRDIAERVE